MKKIPLVLFAILLLSYSCNQTNSEPKAEQKKQLIHVQTTPYQDSIIETYLTNGAFQKRLYSRDRQEEIDKAIAIDSTIAYLWQQKAMPLFKQGKYELGMKFIDKAVKFDRRRYQEYRAFIKCIFANTYKDAIADFEDCRSQFGNNHVMDHSYNFYIAISKLQLNQFEEAEAMLKKEIDSVKTEVGEEWVHYLEVFYLAISQYEQRKYELAISNFDIALSLYPNFSEAFIYKAHCYNDIGKTDKARELYLKAKDLGIAGNSMNEDNTLYEKYPYQIRWENYR